MELPANRRGGSSSPRPRSPCCGWPKSGAPRYSARRPFERLTSGGKTGSAQIFDHSIGKYTHKYNASFAGFARVTNPAVVSPSHSTVRRSSRRGGAPVFRKVAESALRIFGSPRDIPEQLAGTVKDENKEDRNDVALAELSTPDPEPLEAEPAAVAALRAGQLIGPRAPNFTGLSKRAVAEQSQAAGIEVEMVGEGIARAQEPPAVAVLTESRRVRVHFAR